MMYPKLVFKLFSAKIGIVSSQAIIYFLCAFEEDEDQSISAYILDGLKLKYLQNLEVRRIVPTFSKLHRVNKFYVVSTLF